jgi:peptidoglycan/xylan/chitin deacetylase (PgdA/CDA1 family)
MNIGRKLRLKERGLSGFAALIIVILLIGLILLKEETRSEGVSISASGQIQSLELIAVMENEMAEDDPSSQTSTEKVPDYTRMYPNLYTIYSVPKEMEAGRKIAYLTFDDGPSENTFKVLDILEEKDIKATFFIVGSAIKKNNEGSLERMLHEGHTIGIHTYSHMCNEIYCSVERFLDDFNTVYQQIYDITGERVNIYRFPWGSNNGYSKNIKDALMDEMERRGFTCYDWNVDTNDSVGKPSSYSILRNIRRDIKNQDQPIILMHDSSINDLSVQMLPDVIKLLEELGYEFDTLDKREPYQFNW